jgi:hypothetical protein
VMSPGPATEKLLEEGITPREEAIRAVEPAAASGPAVVEEAPPQGTKRLSKAERELAAEAKRAEIARLQEEAERLAAEEEEESTEHAARSTEPEEAPPSESGAKGGESRRGRR